MSKYRSKQTVTLRQSTSHHVRITNCLHFIHIVLVYCCVEEVIQVIQELNNLQNTSVVVTLHVGT